MADSDGNHPYVIQDILPSNEVHLIGGASGVGKTTYLLQFIEEFAAGREFMGHKSFPVPFCYVACDRSKESFYRTLRRMSISTVIPMVSLLDRPVVREDESLSHYAVSLARARVPGVKLLLVDAIGVMCPGKISDYWTVAKFLTGLTRTCVAESITIIGLGHIAKLREGERIVNPRERFLGSVAWGGFSETMIYVESPDPANSLDARRTVYILPRNSKPIQQPYVLDEDGRFIESDKGIPDCALDQWLGAKEQGYEFTVADVSQVANQHGISRATMFRWLKGSPLVAKLDHGRYQYTSLAE